jgi:hypothetical protein
MDYNKTNHADGNLLLVSETLHSIMTADCRPRLKDGRFHGKFEPKWKPPPEWVLIDVDDDTDGIPF